MECELHQLRGLESDLEENRVGERNTFCSNAYVVMISCHRCAIRFFWKKDRAKELVGHLFRSNSVNIPCYLKCSSRCEQSKGIRKVYVNVKCYKICNAHT